MGFLSRSASPSPARSLAGLVLLVLVGMGCAVRSGRLAGPGTAPAPDAVLAQARAAWDQGRTAEALALYAQMGDAAVPVRQRREALLAHGLLLLDPTSPDHDLDSAQSLLSSAAALYEVVPLPLVTASATARALAALRSAEQQFVRRQEEQANALSTVRRDLQAARDESTALARTVRQLRDHLEQRDAALRKAAEAVMGKPKTPTAAQRAPGRR